MAKNIVLIGTVAPLMAPGRAPGKFMALFCGLVLGRD